MMSLPLEDHAARRLTDSRLPAVLVDARRDGFDSVHTDDADGGRLVAEHLLERGYHSFGFLGEEQMSQAYQSPGQRRLAGFRTALASAGHRLEAERVRHTPHGLEQATKAAKELLASPDRPRALFAADDTLAAGALRAAGSLGLAVPGDLALAGFDDSELARALELTTVRQPLEESGHTAADLLIQRITHGPTATRETTLKLELLPRHST
ncbi:substrate-binding domain-containing protein [Streptomyces marispadix]|uniref:substrate-binding domain-containing protein n=1 Tax=Streptomyces marispadix TaxID=2922868 RepID=UPI0027E28E77|nr:substrate-binding domain-containing protein [Streptomyces marispadix]